MHARLRHAWPTVAGVVLVTWLGTPGARAQEPPSLPPDPPAPGLVATDVARLFDAYAIVEAQEGLGLDDEQFARFVSRFKALLEARRRQQQARARLLQELARLTRPNAAANDDTLRERLKALDEHDARAAAEIRQASAAVDDVLTPRQQARFRLFEEQLERKKFDLMMRARQSARPGARRPGRD